MPPNRETASILLSILVNFYRNTTSPIFKMHKTWLAKHLLILCSHWHSHLFILCRKKNSLPLFLSASINLIISHMLLPTSLLKHTDKQAKIHTFSISNLSDLMFSERFILVQEQNHISILIVFFAAFYKHISNYTLNLFLLKIQLCVQNC